MKKVTNMSKWIVPFVIASIFIFTGVAIYLQFVTSVELSSTLILSFYGFCTGELWMLSSIKKTKIKSPSEFMEADNTEDMIEPDISMESQIQDVEAALDKLKEMMQKGDM